VSVGRLVIGWRGFFDVEQQNSAPSYGKFVPRSLFIVPIMLETVSQQSQETARAQAPVFAPVERVDGDAACGLLIICDHAANALPTEYGSLGLGEDQLSRHIGYDIGAAALTRAIAERLGAPALLTTFSRLLIDPNRGEDDPTLVMRLSDGAVVPGNAQIDATEKQHRIVTYYRPYHDAINAAVDAGLARGRAPAIFSVHSFTPVWRGWARPWHAGVLWDQDPRFAVPLIDKLRADPHLVIGDNEPYSGALKNDTLYRHGTKRGIAHALLEVRQDLIADDEGVGEWAERLEPILRDILASPALHDVHHYGSASV